MNLNEAERMALRELKKHGLEHIEFKFDNAKKRFGQARWNGHLVPIRMSLSKHLVKLNTPERVRETIIHEIAHLLLPYREKHGPKWRRLVAELGGRPEARYTSKNTVKPEMPHALICNRCGEVFGRMRWTRKLDYLRAYHPVCGKDSKITAVKNFSSLSSSEKEEIVNRVVSR